MSEIQNNQGLTPADNQSYEQKNHTEHQEGVAFKGEQTDLRFEPGDSVKRTWVNKPFTTTIDGHAVEINSKQIKQVHQDLTFLSKNPAAVQKATALFPAFHKYAAKTGQENPDSLALALEHYAATNEFVANTKLELDEN